MSTYVRFNCKLDPDLYRRLKANLAMKDVSLSDFLRGIIKWYLGRENEGIQAQPGRSEELRTDPGPETEAK